jgi:hypothetical protein
MTVADVIERYLDEPNVERFARDFQFLLKAARGSFGEVELAFRKGRVSVYYRGNSLATIVFRPADMYRIDVHKEFFGSDNNGAGLDQELDFVLAGAYARMEVDARGAHHILSRRNVGRLMKAIRKVNYSEELAFEQILITDNPPSPEFLLIDRQVTDHFMPRRLDLLGLRQLGSGRYGFVVIEVKLGKNAELTEDVAKQLQHYVDHIHEYAEPYARCYEKTYEQKRRLGLIEGDRVPAEIEIDGGEIEGLVVVGGYTRQAEEQKAKLKLSHPELKVHIFRNRLLDEGGALLGSR